MSDEIDQAVSDIQIGNSNSRLLRFSCAANRETKKNMSELGPDYLPVMREALSRFCDEIRSFHADHGNDLTPGSPAVHEKAVSPRPESLVTAWCIAAQLIESGGEHVTAFVKTITEPMEPIACWTCVRSMLESCALASWLLDPRIDARTRIGRVFAIRHEGIEQYLKYVRATGRSGEYLQSLEKRSDEVELVALKLGYPPIVNKKDKRFGIGQKMPSATEVIKLMLDKEEMYRLLSAVTHGHDWAIRELSFSPVREGDPRPDVGGVPVTMFKKTADVDKLALLGLTAAEAFAKPVWDKCNYAGWDKERLIGVLDSTSDKLGLRASKRFWCSAKG